MLRSSGVFREPVHGRRTRYAPRRILVTSAGSSVAPQTGTHDAAAGAAAAFSAALLAQGVVANAAGAEATVAALLVAKAAFDGAAGATDAVSAALVALVDHVEATGASVDVSALLVALADHIEAAGASVDVSALFGRFGHPISDVSNSGWSSTEATLWQALTGERSDASYVSAVGVAAGRLDMTQHVDPGDTLHAIEIASPPGYTPQGTLTVTLYCGVTQIAQWVIADLAADEQRQLELTSGERDAITDYTDLEVKIEASA